MSTIRYGRGRREEVVLRFGLIRASRRVEPQSLGPDSRERLAHYVGQAPSHFS